MTKGLLLSAILSALMMLNISSVAAQQSLTKDESNVLAPISPEAVDRTNTTLRSYCPEHALANSAFSEICLKLVQKVLNSDVDTLIELNNYQVSHNKNIEKYNANAVSHMLTATAMQTFQSKVLFWVSIVAAGVGLLTSLSQFLAAKRRPEDKTEIAISGKEIKISTNWIGLLLLAISLTFLYAVTVVIYPISVAG